MITDATPKTEILVYVVQPPGEGASYRLYDDEDLAVLGGVNAIERELQEESYWFRRLGVIQVRVTERGFSVSDAELSHVYRGANTNTLPKLGKRNPSFRCSQLEQAIFQRAYDRIQNVLDTWNQEDEGGCVEAFALIELCLSRQALAKFAGALQVVDRVHEIVKITVLKFWYDKQWLEPHLPGELGLGDFSVHLPLQVRRSSTDALVEVEVLPFGLC